MNDMQQNEEFCPVRKPKRFGTRFICIFLVLCLMLSFGVAGFTLSYQYTAKTTSRFIAPNLQISVSKNSSSGTTYEYKVQNTGNVPVRVRAFVDTRYEHDGWGNYYPYTQPGLTLNSSTWTYSSTDGWYYANTNLTNNGDSITFNFTINSTDALKSVTGKALNIKAYLFVEAIQAEPADANTAWRKANA